MTLKLAQHIEESPKLTEEAIRSLGKWLYEYSAAFDQNSPHPDDAYRLARDMIHSAEAEE